MSLLKDATLLCRFFCQHFSLLTRPLSFSSSTVLVVIWCSCFHVCQVIDSLARSICLLVLWCGVVFLFVCFPIGFVNLTEEMFFGSFPYQLIFYFSHLETVHRRPSYSKVSLNFLFLFSFQQYRPESHSKVTRINEMFND